MNQEAYDAGFDAALEGNGSHELPHGYVEDDANVEAWYAGHGAGVRLMFLTGVIRMLKGRGYTREQITKAMEETGA